MIPYRRAFTVIPEPATARLGRGGRPVLPVGRSLIDQ